MPAFMRSRMTSRSNSAKTEGIPAIARPDGVMRSSASLIEMKPIPSSVSSLSGATRSVSDLPQRSSRQTIITSISRRRAAFKSSSRCGLVFAPDPTSFISRVMVSLRRPSTPAPPRAREIKLYGRRDGENSSHGAAHAVSSQNQILVEPQRGLAIPGRLTRAESRQRLYARPS